MLGWLALYCPDLENAKQLSDGVLVSKALANIYPERFYNLRTRMRAGARRSLVFMRGNLRRVYISLRSYYWQELAVSLPHHRIPCLLRIARDSDVKEIEKLLKLILGIALTCRHRNRHIDAILHLKPDLKTEVLLCLRNLELEIGLIHVKLCRYAGDRASWCNPRKGSRESNDSGVSLDTDSVVSDQDLERLLEDFSQVNLTVRLDETATINQDSPRGKSSMERVRHISPKANESARPRTTSTRRSSQREKSYLETSFDYVPDHADDLLRVGGSVALTGCETRPASNDFACQFEAVEVSLRAVSCQTQTTPNSSIAVQCNDQQLGVGAGDISSFMKGNNSCAHPNDVLGLTDNENDHQNRNDEDRSSLINSVAASKKPDHFDIADDQQSLLGASSFSQDDSGAYYSLNCSEDSEDSTSNISFETSDIVDIDEELVKPITAELSKQESKSQEGHLASAGQSNFEAEQFQTKISVAVQSNLVEDECQILRDRIDELECKAMQLIEKNNLIEKLQDKIARLQLKDKTSNRRVARILTYLRETQFALKLAKSEIDNLREDCSSKWAQLCQLETVISNLVSTEQRNTELILENQQLKDRIEDLEQRIRNDPWYGELDCSASVGASSGLGTMSRGPTGCSELEADKHESSSLPGSSDAVEVLKLREEATRLTELVEVMEEREEQLQQKLDVGETNCRKLEAELRDVNTRADFSRRVKNVMLLTAAFGAAHQALQAENVLDCLPM